MLKGDRLKGHSLRAREMSEEPNSERCWKIQTMLNLIFSHAKGWKRSNNLEPTSITT